MYMCMQYSWGMYGSFHCRGEPHLQDAPLVLVSNEMHTTCVTPFPQGSVTVPLNLPGVDTCRAAELRSKVWLSELEQINFHADVLVSCQLSIGSRRSPSGGVSKSVLWRFKQCDFSS